MATIGQQVQALKIYKNIRKIKKEAFAELEEMGFFKKLEKSYENLFINDKLDLESARILKLFITDLSKQNEDLHAIYDPMSQAIDSVIKILEISKESKVEESLLVTLEENGNLTCKLNNTKCYAMKNGGLNYNILKLLSRDYTETSKIKNMTGSKSAESIRKAVGKINDNVKRNLKLEHFIESKPGNGYRINNLYNLIKL